MDGLVRLDGEQCGNLDAVQLGRLSQVVTDEIDNHQIFRRFLFTVGQFLEKLAVFFRVVRSFSCSLDRF